MNPRMLAGTRRRVVLVASGALVAAAVALLVWRPWQSRPDADAVDAVVAADNISGNFRACLAADTEDTQTTATADAAWAGIQQAAGRGGINAQRFAVPSAPPADAVAHLNSLAQRECGLIVVVGAALGTAADESRSLNPKQTFLLVDGTTHTGDEAQEAVFTATLDAAEHA